MKSGAEACDDGNNTSESACPYGQATCTACDASCSNVLNLTGGYCGDGTKNGTEVCDDGNTNTETECDYDVASCTACNSTCTQELNLVGGSCGDGVINGSEICDDGNTVDETECAYGQATCTVCNSDCTAPLSLTGPTCGDGVQNGPETCDDGNTNSCGTCNATCTQNQLLAASGTIHAAGGNKINGGETFTLSDGIHAPVIFEFDKNGSVASGHVAVAITNSYADTDVATAIVSAIASAGANLDISANVGTGAQANRVLLTNNNPGSFGNQSIYENVGNNAFWVLGMSGGAGLDCPESTGCSSNQDCDPSLICDTSSHTCSIAP